MGYTPEELRKARSARNRARKAIRRDDQIRRAFARPRRKYGDERTTGRQETPAQRHQRKRVESRERACYFMRGWLTVPQVAAALGRGETWVKRHALELGGRKADNIADLGMKRPGKSWRFPTGVARG